MATAVNPNWAFYDLDRLARNLAVLRTRVEPDKSIFAAIKGNAYGHGALPVARRLEREGVAAFMTGSFDEARRLRAEGLRRPVILFAGALPAGIGELVRADLIPTILDHAGAAAAAAAATGEAPAPVYVKVDMGLGRLGVPEDEAERFLAALADLPGVTVAGLYTHLPFGDRPGHDWARGRFAAFDALLARLDRICLLPPTTQAGASSSVAAGLSDRANAVCVGHLLFGLSPFETESTWDLSAFETVLREVGSRLVQVTAHRQGHDLAIAGDLNSRKGKRIGVAPIGAANGLRRPLPGSCPQALVRGRRVPIIAVSLEHLTLDLDDLEDAAVGDTVLLVGDEGPAAISLLELAGWSGLSCLDTVLALSDRLPARYGGGA